MAGTDRGGVCARGASSGVSLRRGFSVSAISTGPWADHMRSREAPNIFVIFRVWFTDAASSL